MNQPIFSEDENRGELPENRSKDLEDNCNSMESHGSNSSESEHSRDRNQTDSNELPNEMQLQPLDEVPVMAELAPSIGSQSANSNPYRDKQSYQPAVYETDLSTEFRNLAASGGAIGGFVLGVWSIICSLITFFAFVNAGLAIVLGLYGLGSSKKKLAVMGIAFGLIGMFLSFMEISEWIINSFKEAETVDSI